MKYTNNRLKYTAYNMFFKIKDDNLNIEVEYSLTSKELLFYGNAGDRQRYLNFLEEIKEWVLQQYVNDLKKTHNIENIKKEKINIYPLNISIVYEYPAIQRSTILK